MISLSMTHKLALILDAVIAAWSTGCDLDGGDIQHMLERYDLLDMEPFDGERHTDFNSCGVEEGEPWYTPKADVLQLIREARAAQATLPTRAA